MNRDAWIRNVLLRSGRKHGWKQHARKGTLLREVLGILDAWSVRYSANEGGRRFLVAHLHTILKNCKTKTPRKKKLPSVEDFSLDRLKRILAELRDQHILSKYFESNDGRLGFVMAPHDSLCHVKNGVCILQDRSEVFMPQPEPQHWSARAAAAITTLRQHSTQHRDNTELNTVTTPNSTPPLVIGNTELNTELNTTEPVQLYDFADLTDDLIAKWFADGLQTGGSIPCIRLSPVSQDPKNPSYPADFSQEALEHHEHFLKSKPSGSNAGHFCNQPLCSRQASFCRATQGIACRTLAAEVPVWAATTLLPLPQPVFWPRRARLAFGSWFWCCRGARLPLT